MRHIPTDPSSQRNTQAIFVPVAMFSHKASEIVQATAPAQACIQDRIRCSVVGRKTPRIQAPKTVFYVNPLPNGDHMAKPPNYKQEKKRREEAQKKKNEQEQQQKAARKNTPVAPQ